MLAELCPGAPSWVGLEGEAGDPVVGSPAAEGSSRFEEPGAGQVEEEKVPHERREHGAAAGEWRN